MKYANEPNLKKDWPTMINHLKRVIIAALIYFTICFAIVGLLSSCEKSKIPPNLETINTLEDMREWLLYDIEEGKMDSTAYWYLTNLDACINDLRGE